MNPTTVVDTWLDKKIEIFEKKISDYFERKANDPDDKFPKVVSTDILYLQAKVEILKEFRDFYDEVPGRISPSKHSQNKDECKQCGGIGIAPHTCPYAEDIKGDYDTLCTCCEDCI